MTIDLYDAELDVINILCPLAKAGQEEYAQTMRALLRRVAPELLDRAEHDKNIYIGAESSPILEPLLFAYFTSQERHIEATLTQLLAAGRDPQPRRVDVVTNDRGTAFLPGVGYVATNEPTARLQIVVPISPTNAHKSMSIRDVDWQFIPALYVDGTIEVLREHVPLLNQFFSERAAEVAPTIATAAEDMHERLAFALVILRSAWPQLYKLLKLVLRRVVLFRSSTLNSFAHTAAHGTIFLNVSLGDTETFFLEDIAHQGGHVLLSAATFNWSSLMSTDPLQPIAAFAKNDLDERTVSVAVHGLVTEALMSMLLARCINRGLLPPEQLFELTGRCAFIFKRFTSDLATVGRLPVFNSTGARLVRGLFAIWECLAHKYGETFDALDMSNQTYNFSFERLTSANHTTLPQ
jgi:hypothetical protein